VEKYEYEVTTYPAEMFHQLVFYCSEHGACGINEVPSKDTQALQNVLNRRGDDGWELIQLSFGKDGVVSVWKRKRA
jgi:hypothetical protein